MSPSFTDAQPAYSDSIARIYGKSPSISDNLNTWADSGSTTVGIVGPYTYETWAALKTQLSNRLQDPSKIFWTDTELGLYLSESLRIFSFLTWHWRDQGNFPTTPGTSFYDLPTVLPSYLARTVTDRDLINSIQYHFQEPATSVWAGGWTGTAMFTMDDLTHALQKRRNKFLAETGVLITRTVQASGASSDGRILMPQTMIDIRRIARLNTGIYTNLWRVDEHELTAYTQTWTTPAAQDPTVYSIMSTQPLIVQLAPSPTVSATIDILSVSSGADLSPTTTATIFGVPDDMTWIVKWGAMADLLQKDGPAQDPERAKYCEERYQHGVKLARLSASIISARIDTTPLLVCPLAELDAYHIGWQSSTPATPNILATAGHNYIALCPPPVAATPIYLDVIRNAPIPTVDTDLVQIGREMISTILDYAEHLAMFKIGGDEWKATDQLFEQFMSMAGNYNSRMSTCAKLWSEMHNMTNAEESTRLRIAGVRSKYES